MYVHCMYMYVCMYVCMYVFYSIFLSFYLSIYLSICPLSQLLDWASSSGAPQDRMITFFHLTKRYSIVQVQYKCSTV